MLSLPTIKPTTVRYFIELSYSGKAYNGWQIQPNAPSVQQTLQKALSTLLRRTTETVGAGRTDTGVHASHYVAHFDSETEIDRPVDFCYHLNALLPHDIAIRRIPACKADRPRPLRRPVPDPTSTACPSGKIRSESTPPIR